MSGHVYGTIGHRERNQIMIVIYDYNLICIYTSEPYYVSSYIIPSTLYQTSLVQWDLISF